MPLYVQYGCGLTCPDGWLNFDASPRLRIETAPVIGLAIRSAGKRLFPKNARFGNIITGLPVEDRSCDGVYCSHVLEHLDRTSVVKALANTYAILKPGAIFRLVVPDLVWRAEMFLRAHQGAEQSAADAFMRGAYLGVEEPVSGFVCRLRALLGNSAHRWMYDEGLMSSLLADAGFVGIRRCILGDSQDSMFARVEEEDRFFDSGYRELAMEARRPMNA